MAAAVVEMTGQRPSGFTPGVVVSESLAVAEREVGRADDAARGTTFFQDAEVEESLALVGRTHEALTRVRLRLACEVAERGLHVGTGHTIRDWLALRCPDLPRQALTDLSRLAAASREQVHAPLLDGVLSGGMQLGRAALMHRTLVRVRGALQPEQYADAVTLLADAGTNPIFDDTDIDKIVSKMLRRWLPEKDADDAERAKHQLRDVHESSLADGSVRRLIWTFGNDADYEAVRAILISPLSRPASKEEQVATGVIDDRTAGQRRYDALMTVFQRGVAGAKGQPTTAKATLILTLDFDQLRRLLEDRDQPAAGATLGGATITAATIRRMACDAEIIPMVLGSKGEILDQGHAVRTVTPGQRINLAKRDGGCTIPGCTVPATWCDAHHVVPWEHGGPSDLSNYALLCRRHHTWVHQQGLTATVTEFGVTWHLR